MFTIEKIKWTWADKVQSKNVYRDDEFVRAKTKEEALEAIDFLISPSKGLTYTITVFRDGESYRDWETDRKSTRLNSSHSAKSRMPSSA